jgi:hypothetical protein
MANKLTVNLAAVNGVDYAILTGKSDVFPYENGKRTSEQRVGVKLTVALQGNRLAPLSIKFPADPLPDVSDEQISAACVSCKPLYVQLSDSEVMVFSGNNGLGMTATGKTAQIVSIGSK